MTRLLSIPAGLVVATSCGDGSPAVGDPACAESEVGGDACTGRWPWGITVPPDPRYHVEGTPSAGVGRDPDACVCVEPRLSELCAFYGFPDGCPEEAEFIARNSEYWSRRWTCTDAEGILYTVQERRTAVQVCYGYQLTPTEVFGAVEYVYFGGEEDLLVALELVPAPEDVGAGAEWCCDGTRTGRRWVGASLNIVSCTEIDPRCNFSY